MKHNKEIGDLVLLQCVPTRQSLYRSRCRGIGLVIGTTRYGTRVYWFSSGRCVQHFSATLKKLEMTDE